MRYSAIGMVPGDEFPALETLALWLRGKLSRRDNSEVSLQSDTITVKPDGVWALRVTLDRSSYVVQESAELAEHFARHRPDKDVLANAHVRLSVSSDDDSAMDYFNDYVFVCEVLLGIPSIFLFDPITGSIISD